jgi:hypothetical protein
MAAGLTDHVWTLREVLLYRVPPWPQPQTLSAAGEHEDRGAERARCARLQQRRVSQGLVSPVGGTIAGLVIVALTAADRSRPIIRTLQVHDHDLRCLKIPYQLALRFRSTAFVWRLRSTQTLFRWAAADVAQWQQTCRVAASRKSATLVSDQP